MMHGWLCILFLSQPASLCSLPQSVNCTTPSSELSPQGRTPWREVLQGVSSITYYSAGEASPWFHPIFLKLI